MFRRLAVALMLCSGVISPTCEASPDSVVVFNEVHYNPPGNSENGEWIELFNQMGIKVDISGWKFDGVDYTFPAGTILNPGAFVVIAKTPGPGQMGPFTGSIDNGGERLRLINQSDRMMDELNLDDNEPWPAGPDKSGATLAKIQPYTSSGEPTNWTTSAQTNGTPGALNFPTPPSGTGIRLNEIQSTTAGVFGIELTNTSATTSAAGGMIISVDGDPLREYTLPAISIAAGGFLWINEASLGFRPAKGNKLFLYAAGKSAVIDACEATDRLRGRSTEKQGTWLYPNALTPGTANTFALTSSVVISEIQYNPPIIPSTPGTPAVHQNLPLIGFNDTWRYNASDPNLATNWASVSHPVTGNWRSGNAPIGRESDPLPYPIVTSISPYSGATVTYYFEREFSLSQSQLASLDFLEMVHQIDDGAVFYLNGVEISRFHMAEGIVNPETQATPGVGTSATLVTVALPTTALVAGSNRISVEVHQSGTSSSDLVFGMKLDARLLVSAELPALPARDSNNQWVEIANRSAGTVDLSAWGFNQGIDITFPSGTTLAAGEHACVVRDPALFAAAYPGARMLGTFSGSLNRSGETLVLADASGNPADEVRYYDGGRWPEFADGGGCSLELRDLDADNSSGDAWQASDESAGTTWKTYTYTATAGESKGADSQWSEFNLGMLSAGEVWIDDVSVIENNTTQKLVDTGFNNAAAWRLRGNHRHSQIINEPGNPSNKILRIVATGPTEHMHNQIETTLASAVTNGLSYQISFRARWVAGMNQLHTRLYFNRAAKMNVIERPANPGTPSAPNSRAVANAGPTFSSFKHAPAVPAAAQQTTITATAADPDSVASLTLFYSVNGGAFSSTTMISGNGGTYQGTIPGQTSGAVVQFYIRGIDSLGATSFAPAAGPASRALYKVNDNTAATNGLHNFRLITTNADTTFMHTVTEVMSNDRIEATVIDREGDIYYGASVRLKSSQRGRDENGRVGYNIEFPPDALFRGAHAGMAIDRSEGQAPGQFELLFDMMISNSGGPISRYNDLIKILSPNSALTGTALLQMARYEDVFLDEQFADGADGNLYEYELIYYPTTANSSGAKLPSPDIVVNVNRISDQGNSIEDYRWNFLNKINRETENFTPIMNYCKLFSLTGNEFENALPSRIDLDVWFRGMAYAVLSGSADNAGAGSFHNGIYYARPDGRIIFLPHDMDYAFNAFADIFANGEVVKLTANPARKRLYLGHLHDIISSTYNNTYMSIWSSHFATLDPAQNWSSELDYITTRSNNVISQINAQIAPLPFSITTPSPLNISSANATITGTGWINVRSIRMAGSGTPLEVTWTGSNTWQVTVPAAPGSQNVTLQALDFQGAVIGSVAIVVNSTTIIEPASSGNLVVSEIMYHPSDPTPAESIAGFTNAESFEFIELMNISQNPVNLTGVHFTGDLEYEFSSGTILPTGGRIVVAKDRDAFLLRNPSSASLLADGAFLNESGLNNSGDTILLLALSGAEIRNFSYDDVPPWPVAADGDGYSLVLIAPASNPDHALASSWRVSNVAGGNAGSDDSRAFSGNSGADLDSDGIPALAEHALGTSDNAFSRSGISTSVDPSGFLTAIHQKDISADDVVCNLESSQDLLNWSASFAIISEIPTGEGTVEVTARSTSVVSNPFFIRLAVKTR